MFKVFYDCQAKREVDGVALLAFSRHSAGPSDKDRESVREASVNRVLPLLFQLRLSPLLPPSIAAAATAAGNRKKQSTRVFKINCYDGFC